MNFTLRNAAPQDLRVIVALRHAMFEAMGYVNRAELELTDAKFEEWVAPKLADGSYRGWFLQDENGAVVAGAGLWLMEWVPHALDQSTVRGNVLNVYCQPQYQASDLTRRLLIQILDFCRDHGIRTIIANPGDAQRELYTLLGFRLTGEMKIQVSVPD